MPKHTTGMCTTNESACIRRASSASGAACSPSAPVTCSVAAARSPLSGMRRTVRGSAEQRLQTARRRPACAPSASTRSRTRASEPHTLTTAAGRPAPSRTAADDPPERELELAARDGPAARADLVELGTQGGRRVIVVSV